MTKPCDSQQKKRTWQVVDFALLVDHRVKLKESKKRDRYLDLAREQNNYRTWSWQWHQLLVGALRTISKGLA